jgi:hypothetical protein
VFISPILFQYFVVGTHDIWGACFILDGFGITTRSFFLV